MFIYLLYYNFFTSLFKVLNKLFFSLAKAFKLSRRLYCKAPESLDERSERLRNSLAERLPRVSRVPHFIISERSRIESNRISRFDSTRLPEIPFGLTEIPFLPLATREIRVARGPFGSERLQKAE